MHSDKLSANPEISNKTKICLYSTSEQREKDQVEIERQWFISFFLAEYSIFVYLNCLSIVKEVKGL